MSILSDETPSDFLEHLDAIRFNIKSQAVFDELGVARQFIYSQMLTSGGNDLLQSRQLSGLFSEPTIQSEITDEAYGPTVASLG